MTILGLDATTLLIGAKGKLTEPDDTFLFLKSLNKLFHGGWIRVYVLVTKKEAKIHHY